MVQSYGSEGLRLVDHEEAMSVAQVVLKLTFDPGSTTNGLLTAECRLDHPFFVKNKGRKRKNILLFIGLRILIFVGNP